MDPGRLTQGQKIAGIAGLVLLISLFLSWYGVDFDGLEDIAGVDTTVDAWGAFDLIDLVLFLTAVAAIAYAALAAAGRHVDLPVSPAQVVAGLGALSALLVLYRILNQPGPNDLIDVKYGAFIGLLASAAIAYAGVRSLGDPVTTAPSAAAPSAPASTTTTPTSSVGATAPPATPAEPTAPAAPVESTRSTSGAGAPADPPPAAPSTPAHPDPSAPADPAVPDERRDPPATP